MPSNVSPLLIEPDGASLEWMGPVGRVAFERRSTGVRGLQRWVPTSPLAGGEYRIVLTNPAAFGTTSDVLVRFTVALPEDTTPPGAPGVSSVRFTSCVCDEHFDVDLSPAPDADSPPGGLVYESHVGETPDNDRQIVFSPALRFRIENREGKTLFLRVRAHDLAGQVGPFMETWRLSPERSECPLIH